ncbi:amino acid adenylation domain-containing protein, partial [Xanthomonas melonis]|uniref:non-ribosomal peptide synthetase n=1 Tax=Xanthomonas melonis TaxID=56456 RepID=UPI003EBDE04E
VHSAGDGKRLVAYVVARPGKTVPGAGELQRYLGQWVPEYMVPGLYVGLDRLPLTTNGKLDKAALPVPGGACAQEQHEAPQGEVEQALAQIWAQVLEVAQVGRHDNFFELGGDSILSIQIKGLADQRGLVLELADLFDYDTLAELATQVRLAEPGDAHQALAPFELLSVAQRQALPSDVVDAYPLSTMQAGMLFHSDLGGGATTVYHDVYHLDLEGHYRSELLREVLEGAVERHPILCTSFDMLRKPEPLQFVWSQAQIALLEQDGTRLPPQAWEQEYQDWLEQERRTPFDWQQAPLMRAFVHLRTTHRWRLTLSFHHAILDGWSLAQFLAELLQDYRSLLTGQPILSQPPRSHYAEFIAAERRAMADDAADHFWAGYLRDADVLQIEPLQPLTQPAVSDVRSLHIPLSPQVQAGLKQRVEDCQAPMKSVLLAGHLQALSLYFGKQNPFSGILVHGRPDQPDGERTLGLFLNNVPLRLPAVGLGWRELVKAVHEEERRLFPHRLYPHARISRLLGGSDAIQTAFNFTKFHAYKGLREDALLRAGNAQVKEHSTFPLVLQTAEDPDSGELLLRLEFDPRRLDEVRAAALAAMYAQVFAALALAPQQRPDEVPLVPMAQWCISEEHMAAEVQAFGPLFDAVCAEAGAATAVQDGDGCWSYDRLRVAVHTLAGRLQSHGVGVGTRVGVCLERSTYLPVAMLAIWSVGATYVPLAADQPAQRLEAMLRGCAIAHLVVSSVTVARLPTEVRSGRVLIACELGGKENAAPAYALGLRGDDAAYIIFTSGSTGTPKAVVVPWRGVCNLVAQQRAVLGAGVGRAISQFAALTFDASVFEMVMALLTGGALHIVEERRKRDPDYLHALIGERSIDLLTLPPSYLAVMDPLALPRPVTVVAAGEALPPASAERWSKRHRLFNAYGPTEATVWSTWHAYNGCGSDRVPIGRPLSGVGVRLLDTGLRPVPAGMRARLYLTGPALAHGYTGDAARTAARFLPDPYADVAGARMYDTGDVVCMLPNGELDFMGRDDRQVKLRGYRIELDEVETALNAVPGVEQAAVELVERADGRCELVGLVQTVPGFGPPERAADVLAGRLPDYCVPQRFVALERMPQTRHEKLDRAALRILALSAEATSSPDVASPLNDLEQTLARIWMEVLELDAIDPDDSFFTLGGDSILSIQLRALTHAHGYDFELEDLFKQQSIRNLAPRVMPLARKGSEAVVPFSLVRSDIADALRGTVDDVYPLSRMQAGMLFHQDFSGDDAVYHDIMNYTLGGEIDPHALEQALGRLISRHDILRTGFDLSRFDTPLQVVHRDARSHFGFHDLSALAADEQRIVLAQANAQEKTRPFDLARPSLLRVELFRLGPGRHQLNLSCPHAILDGWSAASLMTELVREHRRGGSDAALEATALRYADFLALEQAALQSQPSRAFWQERLLEEGRVALPTRPDVSAGGPLRVEVPLAVQHKQALTALAAQLGVRLRDVMLAIHLKAISVITGSAQVCSGVVVNGRPESAGGERVLGMFLNTLPASLKVTPGSWRSLIERVRDMNEQHWSHRRFPMTEMKRIAGGQALFDVVFNFTHFHVYEKLGESGVTLEGTDGFEYSNYPLTFQAGYQPWRNELHMMLDLDSAAIDQGKAQLFAGLYAAVAQHMASDVYASHGADFLAHDARLQLLSWAGSPGAGRASLSGRFAQVAQDTPQAVAVQDAEGTLSYAQLEAASAAI